MEEQPTIEVSAERAVAGGRTLCRDADGRIVLAEGALPGERVRVAVEQRKGTAQGVVAEVLEPSARRVEPPCPFVAHGCGGCDWQHAEPALQSEMRLEVVADALRRLGHVDDPNVTPGPPLAPERVRTTLRVAVADDGSVGFRHRGSHEVVPVDDCLLAVPALAELLRPGVLDPGEAAELTLRVASTGERLVVAEPTAEGVRAPDDVAVVGTDELDAGRRRWFHTEVAGATLRASARSFLQASDAGAEALVAVVADLLDGAPDGTMVDLYGGMGLFAATVAGDRAVVVVERSKDAVADARVNLEGRDAKVIGRAVARWTPDAAAVVVADPPRAGLAKAGVAQVAATGADRVVLVSCDAGALGRDTALLQQAGYAHRHSVVLDLFGHSHHVEVATRFDRTPNGSGQG